MTEPVEQRQLKACPFCGEAPKWRGTRHDYVRGLFRLQCLGETHLMQSYGPTEAAAVANWNERDLRPDDALREALNRITVLASNHGGWFENEGFGLLCRIGDIANCALDSTRTALEGNAS